MDECPSVPSSSKSSKVVLFYEKCRLCLDEPGASNMFETEALARDIFSCTGVRVTPSDNLPQKICTQCSDIIAKAKELRLLAKRNDSHLKSLFDYDDDSEEITEEVSVDEEDIPSSSKACDEDNKKVNKTTKTNNRKQSSLCAKNQSSEPVSKEQSKKLSVRKDLFETSAVVSSSRKLKRKEEFDADGQRKRVKWDTDPVEYNCKVCSKKFETWKKLYLHQRLHNKTMACPLDGCGKAFATKGDLEKHLRTHTGVKPYHCEICDKKFTQNATLKAHKENVHYSYIFK